MNFTFQKNVCFSQQVYSGLVGYSFAYPQREGTWLEIVKAYLEPNLVK